ncbi:alpha/beta hydrolase [Kytococcus schroeteri]|uniref:Alpha/beta hydrolase n=2 Tax=Kytococcus schroeteri TaxID=138300 RepID=A0A2I1PDR8_9MICO|nr:alpha/beta hydrolase [Kytococcus schroeteri]PKZ42761.1 alpha/beta hydrolase [Kytococcus schroeteri]
MTAPTPSTDVPDPAEAPTGTTVLLLGGLWLDEHAWDALLLLLEAADLRAQVVALPGASTTAPDPEGVTLDDQLGAVLATIDATSPDGPVVVVGHSAACTLAWMAADRRPGAVRRVVLVGGVPSTGGEQYAAFFPIEDGVMAHPGWEPFAGPDSDDLDEAAKADLLDRAIPVPQGVAEAVVEYTDEARFDVPITLVCPEFTPEQVRQWQAADPMPELAGAQVDFIDIDTGHWPMVSAPQVLGDALVEAVRR